MPSRRIMSTSSWVKVDMLMDLILIEKACGHPHPPRLADTPHLVCSLALAANKGPELDADVAEACPELRVPVAWGGGSTYAILGLAVGAHLVDWDLAELLELGLQAGSNQRGHREDKNAHQRPWAWA